jgi:DMSO reductase family type II enzyme heme b subunit
MATDPDRSRCSLQLREVRRRLRNDNDEHHTGEEADVQLAQVSENLSDPTATGWSSVATEKVELEPIPIDAQPTEYVRVKWADLPYGTVREVRVAAAHDGTQAYFRLDWADDTVPNTEFHDAAAVYFPADADAPARTIGADNAAVDIVFWQANLGAARNLVGTGPGRFRPSGTNGSTAAATLDNGRWAVVLTSKVDDVRASGRFGVVVWNGSNEERAGLGASSDWLTLDVA